MYYMTEVTRQQIYKTDTGEEGGNSRWVSDRDTLRKVKGQNLL